MQVDVPCLDHSSRKVGKDAMRRDNRRVERVCAVATSPKCAGEGVVGASLCSVTIFHIAFSQTADCEGAVTHALYSL